MQIGAVSYAQPVLQQRPTTSQGASDGYAGSTEQPPQLLSAARHLLKADGPLGQAFSVPGDRVSHFAPLVTRDAVYVMKDRLIHQYTPRGEFVRAFAGDHKPARLDDLLISQEYHTLYTLEQDGQSLWNRDVGRGGGAARKGDTLFIGGEPKVEAVDARTGAVKWATQYKEVTSFQVLGYAHDRVLAQSQGHVETHDQYLRAYDPANGKELWKLESKEIEVKDGHVFARTDRAGIPPFLGPKTTIRCLDQRGKTTWKVVHKGGDPLKWTAGPDGTVYLVRKTLEAHGPEGQKWSQPLDPKFDLPPVASEHGLLLASQDGSLLAIDAKTGEPRWRQDGLGEMLVTPEVGPDGAVYVKTREGAVKAFRPFDAGQLTEPVPQASVQVDNQKVVLNGVRLSVRNATGARDQL